MRLSQRAVTPPAQIPQNFQFENNFAQPTTESLPSDSSTVAASTVPMEPEPTPDAAPVEVIPPPSTSPEQEHGRSNSRERSPQPTHAAPSTAQPARVLRADNRLLELLDKDLDKAIEHPNEPRRLQFSKEVTNNGQVRRFVRYYSTTGKNRFQELLGRSGKYMPMIAKVLSQEGLPEELGYLALLESEFVVKTTSRTGAVGLWQFVASTAVMYGLRIDNWVDERRDPVKSTRAAAAYLKDLHGRYGRWYLATAAYNAGPGTIDRALQQSGAKDFWSLKAKAQLSEETRDFVPKFVAIALIAMDPKKYGLNDVVYEKPLDYEEVELKTPMSLAALAQSAETDVVRIRNLNPALLRDSTPPGEAGFRVNVPVEKAAALFANITEKTLEKTTEPARIVMHEVKKGETLFSIARRYGLEVSSLMDFNGLTTPRLQIGQKLRILLEGLRGVLR
ncbi:MAG TPA: transglycosylase SLT domain-containing protein [Candidatus Binatia bacterium]